MQQVQRIAELPDEPLQASATYFSQHLDAALRELGQSKTSGLVVILPSAGPDHDDWRRSLARDLARKSAPKRTNVIGVASEDAEEAMLAYLRNAPGVTGQYLAAHD